jgi:IrrE N-terminal-like domain
VTGRGRLGDRTPRAKALGGLPDRTVEVDVVESRRSPVFAATDRVGADHRICLNARDVPALRRFTLAHEVGHWVCQCLEGRTAPVFCRAEDVSAAELLMPEPAVRAGWAETHAIAVCAARFDLSPSAMQWRLHSFDLVQEQPA